jgi:hypothetical protein
MRRATGTASATAALLVLASTFGWETPARAATFGASWQFNETSGLAIDSTGNGNSGTLHGGIRRTGTGYDFDGSTGYVSVPDSSSLDPGSADIALTVRFNVDPVPSGYDYDLIRKGLSTTSGGDYKAEVVSGGRGLCHFRGSKNSATITGGSGLESGTHTLKCVKTSSSVQLVVDGSVKATKAITVGSISNGSGVPLGAKPGDDFTNGFIDFITVTITSP